MALLAYSSRESTVVAEARVRRLFRLTFASEPLAFFPPLALLLLEFCDFFLLVFLLLTNFLLLLLFLVATRVRFLAFPMSDTASATDGAVYA